MSSDQYITPHKLNEALRSPDGQYLLVDCRSASDFQTNRIKGAINITIPASVIMLRRLENGKMNIPSIIRGARSREKFGEQWKTHTVVLYDQNSEKIRDNGPCVLSTLFRRVRQDGCQVLCLQGKKLFLFLFLTVAKKKKLFFHFRKKKKSIVWENSAYSSSTRNRQFVLPFYRYLENRE